MRMRKMKNLEPRMEKCAVLRIAAPEEMKGKCIKASKTVIFSQTNLVYHILCEVTRGNRGFSV